MFMKVQRIGKMLESIFGNNSYLTLGYFVSVDGLLVFDNDEVVDVVAALEAFTPRKRPWYRGAVRAGSTIWTKPYVDANTKKLTVTVATPVYAKNRNLLGVVGLDVLLDTIQEDILS